MTFSKPIVVLHAVYDEQTAQDADPDFFHSDYPAWFLAQSTGNLKDGIVTIIKKEKVLKTSLSKKLLNCLLSIPYLGAVFKSVSKPQEDEYVYVTTFNFVGKEMSGKNIDIEVCHENSDDYVTNLVAGQSFLTKYVIRKITGTVIFSVRTE